jgi:hypothetical protein
MTAPARIGRTPPRSSFAWHKWWEGYCTMRMGFDKEMFRYGVTNYRRRLMESSNGRSLWAAFKDGCRDGLDEARKHAGAP